MMVSATSSLMEKWGLSPEDVAKNAYQTAQVKDERKLEIISDEEPEKLYPELSGKTVDILADIQNNDKYEGYFINDNEIVKTLDLRKYKNGLWALSYINSDGECSSCVRIYTILDGFK